MKCHSGITFLTPSWCRKEELHEIHFYGNENTPNWCKKELPEQAAQRTSLFAGSMPEVKANELPEFCRQLIRTGQTGLKRDAKLAYNEEHCMKQANN